MGRAHYARGVAFTALAACLLATPAVAQKRGGDLNVLLYAGFNSIDPHFTATYPARNALLGIYETLVTVDENGSTIPMLAEKVDISQDGLTYRFPLRKGVKFHNGKEMTAADVKASLERYARLSPQRVALDPVASIETPDPYLVVVTLKAANPNFLDRLAAPTSPVSIIPAEEAAKDLNKTNNISTGPFQFVEWVPDSHYRMKRFDGYVPNKSMPERTGFGGPKTVYLDTVTLRVVAEASARVAALEAGQAQFIEDVPGPAAQRLAGNPKIKVTGYSGLTIDYARKINAQVIVRGLRVFSDFEFEFRMALANQRLATDIETVALITAEEHTFLSSSTVREIAALGGDVSSMVPPFVNQALRAKVTTLGDQHSPPNALRD